VKTRRRTSVVVLLVSLLSGCWLQPGFGPERQNSNPFESGLTPANVADVTRAWSYPVADFRGGQPLVTGTAVVVGGVRTMGRQTVFAVEAVDQGTGEGLWLTHLETVQFGTVGAVLSVADGEVVAAYSAPEGGGTHFTRLDAETGAIVATESETALVDPATAVVNNSVIAYRAADPTQTRFDLVVRSRHTFEVVWTAPTTRWELHSLDPLVLAGNRIYLRDLGPAGPVVHAYPVAGCGAATCAPTATLAVPPPDTEYVSLDARLLAATDDGRILVRRSWSGPLGVDWGIDLVALSSDAPAWIRPGTSLDGVAVVDDTVFVTGRDEASAAGNSLLAFQTTTGSLMWRFDSPFMQNVMQNAPIAAGGVVYVEAGETPTDVFAFAADGCGALVCSELAVIDTGPDTGGFYGMSVAGGSLFVNKVGPNGQLIAYQE
jgi:outer membrane protein assembly factor BamB